MEKQKRTYFMKTERFGFSKWKQDDIAEAVLLWGDPQVTRYICASGVLSREDIRKRLQTEIENGERHQVQYWPVFVLETEELLGCCGLRPHGEKEYELGFHLRPKFWGSGYAAEAAEAVIGYAFDVLQAETLFAGHNPHNTASRKRLLSLGFAYMGDEFYAPTGLHHPSYHLEKKKD